MAALIENELDSFTPEQIAEAEEVAPDSQPLHILFSAHGVPQSYIEAGDPYQRQIEACVDGISKEIKNKNVEVHLSYQSRVGVSFLYIGTNVCESLISFELIKIPFPSMC
jgi:ferrochelatase